ncbi:hypothetical protein [Paractinoplanes atraurantiacus]|uniref:hypothetical protein n=1 Tax=Paractinoplanes atraurantiacus TaxID=1036182 RepID=UPI0011784983|nr:hypothetical protein [Actinoplanes atraurantiacus]
MAVIQQLARLSSDQLDACREVVEKLDDLCSFRLLPASDHLDLDWASAPLLRAFELARFPEPAAALLRHAIGGDSEINPAYRDVPDSIFEHPVTALEPVRVAEVATALAAAQTPELEGHLDSYLRHHLGALRDFYTEAADRALAVALWWD